MQLLLSLQLQLQLQLQDCDLHATLQAVALGAAVQAGILEGQISDVMVMDVWQANLMRALAQKQLKQSDETAASLGLLDQDFPDEVLRHDSLAPVVH